MITIKINIVHEEIYWDDKRNITAIEIKLKSLTAKEENDENYVHRLVAIISSAFHQTTLFADVGGSCSFSKNKQRPEIVNAQVSIEKPLSRMDVVRFIETFQKNIDESKLFV